MDRIELKRMPFFAHHGVFAEEKRLGQRFVVSVVLYLDLRVPGTSDAVADTVDYGKVYDKVKTIAEQERFNLIEALAERIAREILDSHPSVEGVCVEVEKPGAPVSGILDTVSVGVERWRNQGQRTLR